jgi:hypothetical protein
MLYIAMEFQIEVLQFGHGREDCWSRQIEAVRLWFARRGRLQSPRLHRSGRVAAPFRGEITLGKNQIRFTQRGRLILLAGGAGAERPSGEPRLSGSGQASFLEGIPPMALAKSVSRSTKKPLPSAAPILAAVAACAQGEGVLPVRNKSRLRARPAQLAQKNRFATKGAEGLDPEAVRFGAAMQTYLGSRYKAGWTCGEVLDVMMSLGWKNLERDFEVNVHALTTAIALLKRGTSRRTRRRFPTFSEVLAAAASLGWYRGV